MARFEVRKSWAREEVLSMKQKWLQILMDEKIKLRVRELLSATRNYPNYIVSVRAEYEDTVSFLDTITKYYYDNYSATPIFATSNNPDHMNSIASAYTLIELMVSGKWMQMERSGVIRDAVLALNFNPVITNNTYLIAYFMVKDPSVPARLIRRYRKLINGNKKYWGDTLIYNWDPSNYVPEAIMSVMRRSNELCSTIPTCTLAMLYKRPNEPFSTVGFDLRIKLEDLSYGIKESWLGGI
ncbi:MAG: hypothetical protein RXR03_08270 [Thermocladium sp.]